MHGHAAEFIYTAIKPTSKKITWWWDEYDEHARIVV